MRRALHVEKINMIEGVKEGVKVVYSILDNNSKSKYFICGVDNKP